MNDRILAAKALRDQNIPYSAIGDALGVSRQRAFAMVKQAENLASFTNVNAPKAPTSSGELLAAPTAPTGGSKPVTVEGTRMSYDIAPAGNWSFSKLTQVMEKLRQNYDPLEFYALGEEMLERDANLRSLLDIRVAQTSSQPLIPDVTTASLLREKKATQAGIDMLMEAGFRDVMPQILAARFFSVCILELEWELTATARTVKAIHWRDPKGFIFDRQDPRKVYIKPDQPGGELTEAPAGRFVVVFANGKPGTPVRSGLALPAAWEYVKKAITEFDWTVFLNKYGKPTPTLNIPNEVKLTPKERADVRRMANQLGTGFVPLLEGGITIDFPKDSTVSGSSEAFEKKVRYHDEQSTKLLLGGSLANGTGNTGSGGTQSLGTVHGDLRYDLQKSDAQMPEAAANEILYWHAVFNKGADAFVPKVKLELDEPEDKAAARENAKAAHEMGLPLSISKTAEQLGVFLAETEEDKLQAPSAPATNPAAAALSAALRGKPCPVHTPAAFAQAPQQRDAIDDLADAMLAEYEQVTPSLDSILVEAVLSAGSVEKAVAALKAAIEGADVSALEALFTKKATATRAAGKLGGEV